MNRKDIKEKRMKSYFIEASKKIIKEKGVGELTVKKVADLAGYAPATLYNYFNNLDELLFYTVVDFFRDCKQYVLERSENSKTSKETIVGLAIAYSRYFIENPNIYQLAFLVDIKVPKEEFNDGRYVPEIVKLTLENLKLCAQEGTIDKEDIEIILGLIANSVNGNILFFIKERASIMTKEEVIKKIEREVRYVLEK